MLNKGSCLHVVLTRAVWATQALNITPSLNKHTAIALVEHYIAHDFAWKNSWQAAKAFITVTEKHRVTFSASDIKSWQTEIKALCLDIKDTKIPVTLTMLQQLYQAANLLFCDYNAVLFKAVWSTAFLAMLQEGEYTEKEASHNIKSKNIHITPKGLGITFTTSKGRSHKPSHCFYPWPQELPDLEMHISRYAHVCPTTNLDAAFFVTRVGYPLLQAFAKNRLNLALLNTEWRHIAVTPHCFCLGGATYFDQKMPTEDLKKAGCWCSQAFLNDPPFLWLLQHWPQHGGK